jgi:hypothetical protein
MLAPVMGNSDLPRAAGVTAATFETVVVEAEVGLGRTGPGPLAAPPDVRPFAPDPVATVRTVVSREVGVLSILLSDVEGVAGRRSARGAVPADVPVKPLETHSKLTREAQRTM